VEDVEEMFGGETSEAQAGESGPGDEDTLEGIGLGQDSGQGESEEDPVGPETPVRDGGIGLETGEKEGSDPEAGDLTGKAEQRFEEEEGKRENEQLGLPMGSLGQEYNFEADSNIKKDKLLAEEFDGYLGSMDRHYNHYILIPDGEYIIGSKHPKKDEKPEQVVYLEAFYCGRFPITNGLFEIFVEKTGYKTTAEKVGYGTVYHGRFEKKKDETTGLITSTWNSSLYSETIEGACWYQPSGPKSTLYNKRSHPVVQISMEDAMAFAAWTGKRLPTENEWEAASRTANGWIFSWGPEWEKDVCNIEDSYIADTTSVDKYVEFENDFGIVDTIGNVLEWTNDSFDSTSKKDHGTKYRAVKGGSWISGNDIRLFSRFMVEPESHSNILGFRCVAY
ncbi:MAG: formylglycine-generating enzyme family protein, partial [Proteobacteria bacterium]|nr:formylglycine-generating enzyme family protein [Pseudomonadota bacterium]